MRGTTGQFPRLLALAGTLLAAVDANSQVMSGHSVSSMPGVESSLTSSLTGTTPSGPGVVSRPTRTGSAKPGSTPGRVSGSASHSGAGRGAAATALSPSAEELARIIMFDRSVLIILKEETQEHLQRLIGYDEKGYQIIVQGIAVSVPEDKTDRILAALRKKLRPKKYLPFVAEMNAGLKIDKIGVLKGTDQYDILRTMQTCGAGYDISNQDIIDRLKEWERSASFDIIGADADWVELEFRVLPKDLKAFAEEVYDFSPDTVEQGPGTVAGLAQEIQLTKRLFLWWD